MDYMERALSLARQALGNTSPNPTVGAIIVNNGIIVGEGYTQPPGSAHAEIVALRQAGEAARGATMYVTLEPCAHYGRTPPCTRAIIDAGIAEVRLAVIDPNPLVSGKGVAELQAAGVRTHLGERQEEAQELNEAYFKFITTGCPFVTAKFAMSLDGKIATRGGDSRWITSERSREYAQALRRVADAIMVGINTVVADNPRLTARDDSDMPESRQPLRVVLDSRGRIPPTARLLREPGQTIVAVAQAIEGSVASRLAQAGAEVLELPSRSGLVDVTELLKVLGKRQVTSVLAEGGGELSGSLFDAGLVDKVYAFIAPIVIGGRAAIPAVGGQGVERLAEAVRLTRVKVERMGDDLVVSGYPVYSTG